MNKKKLSSNNNGFALATALLIITAFGAILTGVVFSTTSENDRREAQVAGWEAVQVGRAARLWVRNQIESVDLTSAAFIASGAANPREFVANSVATYPEISIDQLIAQNLLPANFARQNAAGDYFNALGQEIRVIAGNYPINGTPTDETTVPTAFVYFVEDPANPKSNPELAQLVVQSAREQNTPISAPLFSGANNISGTCVSTNPANTGGMAAVMWDSGCLDYTEFTTLTGDNFTPQTGHNMAPGSLVIPAWRTVNFDTRALMRFPQPEQTGLQTMQTDLDMAEFMDCDADDDGVADQNFIQIPDDIGGMIDTAYCGSQNDNASAAVMPDRRRSFLKVGSLEAANLIVDPQANPDVALNGAIAADDANDLFIAGDLTGTGDAKIYNNVTVTDRLKVDKNIIVSGATGANPASSQLANLSAANATSDTLSVAAPTTINAPISVRTDSYNVNNFTSDSDIITQNLITNVGTPTSITITDTTNILQPSPGMPLNIDQVDFSGGGQELADRTGIYSAVARFMVNGRAELSNSNITVTNNADMNGTLTAGEFNVTNGDRTARCIGDCPLESEQAQCQQLAPLAGISIAECLNQYRPTP